MIEKFVSLYMRKRGKEFLKLKNDFRQETIKQGGNKTALYIHIPFCKTLCPYCSFTKYEYSKKIADDYFKSLKKEIEMYHKRGFSFSNVYVGGGTPTIDMKNLIAIIDYVKKAFKVDNISVETTVDHLDKKSLTLMKKAGVTRLSVGIQSFNKDILQTIKRQHYYNEDVGERLELANKSIKTLNVDLIFNFKGQTIESLAKDIDIVRKLAINQVTYYPLMPNRQDRDFGRVDYSKEKKYYYKILDSFTAPDYYANSVWCFSKGDGAVDEYFVDNDEYVGVGCGAISFTGNTFRVNTFSLEKYSENISNGKTPVALYRVLTDKELSQYLILTKLFGLKINKQDIKDKFGKGSLRKVFFEISAMKLLGWVKESREDIVLTRKGMFMISVMTREFFSSLNNLRDYCTKNKI